MVGTAKMVLCTDLEEFLKTVMISCKDLKEFLRTVNEGWFCEYEFDYGKLIFDGNEITGDIRGIRCTKEEFIMLTDALPPDSEIAIRVWELLAMVVSSHNSLSDTMIPIIDRPNAIETIENNPELCKQFKDFIIEHQEQMEHITPTLRLELLRT